MKGISHFASAIAAATFIPGVILASADEQSMILLLAGIFGLMPDWLDFKFARYFEPPDKTLTPNPASFDPQAIAGRLAALIDQAYEVDKPITVQLNNIPLGLDRFRQYGIRFDNAADEVVVTPGPILNSSGRPLVPVPQPSTIGRARTNAKLNYTYDGEMKIDIFEGPSFEFRREGKAVEVSFLPWHRRWTHSLVLAAVFGLLAGLLWGPMAGAVAALAYSVHVIEDQLGHLGSNLLWPFTERRSSGLGLLHSGDPLPNFFTVWTSAMLILFNLNRFADQPQFDGNVFLLWAVFLPATLMIGAMVYGAKGRAKLRQQAEQNREAVAETEEPQSV
jgi:membrane-bound metal-dependent hydrolase YbcI (DUF457 family)